MHLFDVPPVRAADNERQPLEEAENSISMAGEERKRVSRDALFLLRGAGQAGLPVVCKSSRGMLEWPYFNRNGGLRVIDWIRVKSLRG
jgi:hypothetical protein